MHSFSYNFFYATVLNTTFLSACCYLSNVFFLHACMHIYLVYTCMHDSYVVIMVHAHHSLYTRYTRSHEFISKKLYEKLFSRIDKRKLYEKLPRIKSCIKSYVNAIPILFAVLMVWKTFLDLCKYLKLFLVIVQKKIVFSVLLRREIILHIEPHNHPPHSLSCYKWPITALTCLTGA